ncbi:hypothetical protein HHI36_015537 [Cryptolaemus montrouzieri]|uniref:Uncharacterized protein n=1 Tax=Cryptolaemus montrouzieri TaxID=559131 RepID=A0ABD2N5X5_9CUCU
MSSTVDDSMLTTEYDSTLPAKDDTNEESINDAEEDKNSTVMKRCRRQTNSIPFYLEEQTDDEENVTSDVETEHSANQKENLETPNDDQDEISLKIGQQNHKEIQKNVAKTNFVHKTKGRRRQKQTKLRNVEKETKEEVKIKTEDTVESEKTEASLKKNPEQMQIEDDVGTNEAENMLTNKNESTEYNSQQSTQVSLNVEHEKKEKPSRNIEDECITNKIESNLSFKQTRNGIIDSVQDDLLINQNVSEMSIDMKDCDHNKHAIEDKLDAGKNGIKSVETEKMLLIKKGSHVGVIEDDTKCNKGNPDNKTLLQDNLVQSNVKSASKSEKPQQQISVPKRIPKNLKRNKLLRN